VAKISKTDKIYANSESLPSFYRVLLRKVCAEALNENLQA